jgi:catechol 2,3-dioxygenase-like lactoylglutathione lyase family enzyme
MGRKGRGEMTKLGYVTLNVRPEALEEVRDWYVETLGLSVVWRSRGFCMLGGEGGARLGLYAGEPLARPERVQLHFEVEDVDAEYEDLAGQGVPFEEPPHNTSWGYRVTALKDVAGHMVELYASLDEDEDL